MANQEQVSLLKQGVEAWNNWRLRNPDVFIDLKEANFEEAFLYKANLKSADLTGVNFKKANLSEANLINAYLGKANFEKANLIRTHFTGSYMGRAYLVDASLQNADLRHADLTSANFRNAVLTSASLNGGNLYKAKFSNANLTSAVLTKVVIEGTPIGDISANFSKANLSGCNLTYANLKSCNFSEADLSYSYLHYAVLDGINLSGAILTQARLNCCSLSDANLSRAVLDDAILERVNALDANFSSASLTGACIHNWNINAGTDFEDVICKYFYQTFDWRQDKPVDRRPREGIYEPGEFFVLIQQSLYSIELIFADGIDWQAFFQSLQEVRQDYPKANVGLQAIEKKGSAFVIRLESSPDADQRAIESLKRKLNDAEKKVDRSEGKIEILQDQIAAQRHAHKDELEVVVKTMAENGSRDSGKSNFFMTFISWVQNTHAIAMLIGFVIGVITLFLMPKMYPNGFPPVNPDPQPEAIQSVPSSPKAEIGIGKRIAQQVHQFLQTSE